MAIGDEDEGEKEEFLSFLLFQVQRQQWLSRAAIIEPLVVGSRQCVVTYVVGT